MQKYLTDKIVSYFMLTGEVALIVMLLATALTASADKDWLWIGYSNESLILIAGVLGLIVGGMSVLPKLLSRPQDAAEHSAVCLLVGFGIMLFNLLVGQNVFISCWTAFCLGYFAYGIGCWVGWFGIGRLIKTRSTID